MGFILHEIPFFKLQRQREFPYNLLTPPFPKVLARTHYLKALFGFSWLLP